MWSNLAVASGFEHAKKFGERLEKEMTVAQIAKAQWLSKVWKPCPDQGELALPLFSIRVVVLQRQHFQATDGDRKRKQ
jgi:hypothetical protein